MSRIISVSSGKGGVGKTTFALNYALNLSLFGKTILIDLDMGTSSIRNHLDMNIYYDIYHFFRKDIPLENCINSLPPHYDPQKKYKNFYFIASPKGFFEDIVNLNYSYKLKLINAINKLDADYIILDLRAGLDYRVLDFLPLANTGIIIFTPLVPAAVFAATELVVALVVRRLRKLFSKNSPIYRSYSHKYYHLFNELLDKIEDIYDNSFTNFDDFLNQLKEALGISPVSHYVESVLHSFKVYYILNQFNGLTQCIEKVIKPLADSIKSRVSSYVQLINLGWIIYDEAILEAASKKIPALLYKKEGDEKRELMDDPFKKLEQIRKSFLPSKSLIKKTAKANSENEYNKININIDPLLNSQLEILKAMLADNEKMPDFKKNFDFITRHTLYIMKNYPFYSFGDKSLSLSLPSGIISN